MKIGIIGEHPINDSKAMIHLLRKKFSKEQCNFIRILKNDRGGQLDSNSKIKRVLKREFLKRKLDFIIYLRDLNGLINEKKKVEKLENWFNDLEAVTNQNGILFIIIYEAEALILADIETFNTFYKTKITYKKNPKFQGSPPPKEFLIRETSKKNIKRVYAENQAEKIFQELDFETVYQNHNGELSFKEFIDKLEEKIQ